MNLEIELNLEKLSTDLDYWNTVAPENAEFCFVYVGGLFVNFKPFFAVTANFSDYFIDEYTEGWTGEKTNGAGYHVFSAVWKKIDRPAAWDEPQKDPVKALEEDVKGLTKMVIKLERILEEALHRISMDDNVENSTSRAIHELYMEV